MGFAAGEALVPEVQRQAGQSRQLLCEDARFGRLGAQFSGEVERIAGHDACALVFPTKASQGTEIIPGIALADEREYRLSRVSELAGDSHADALGADVQAQKSTWMARGRILRGWIVQTRIVRNGRPRQSRLLMGSVRRRASEADRPAAGSPACCRRHHESQSIQSKERNRHGGETRLMARLILSCC